MNVLPVYSVLSVLAHTFSASLVGGGSRMLDGFLSAPFIVGLSLPVQPLGFIAGEPATSIRSALVRPNVGWPQIRKLSFVCIGPFMASPVTKLTSGHDHFTLLTLVTVLRCGRKLFAQYFCALLRSVA